ncbi:MAG: type II secretion system F family protein [Gammaproteobacteria bacterium]|nr:type II secretion system F family protein [Gammaproteobacteria bacterium]
MPEFSYQARDAGGQAVTGHREAADAGSLARELSAAGLIPVSFKEEAEAESDAPDRQFGWFKRKVSVDEVILLSRQMASLTRAGIPVDRAMRGLAESHRNPRLQAVLMDASATLESGSDVASALRRHPTVFNELYASVIHVGENTGRLDEAFKQIAGYLEVERETRKRIKTATRYPSFVLITIGVAIGILNVFVIPAFAKVFDKFNAELPWQTQVIMGFSDFMVAWWPALLLGTVGSYVAFRYYVTTPSGRYNWDWLKLRLPILGGIFERINLGRFCQTFAMVSRAGVPITQGLQVIARAIGNDYMAERINGMRQGIERGSSITVTARESGMFSPVVLQMMAVGEETGSMDELMEQSAQFYEEEVDYQLKSLTDAVEPVLIIAIGIMVLILALGVFLPLWDLSAVANR